MLSAARASTTRDACLVSTQVASSHPRFKTRLYQLCEVRNHRTSCFRCCTLGCRSGAVSRSSRDVPDSYHSLITSSHSMPFIRTRSPYSIPRRTPQNSLRTDKGAVEGLDHRTCPYRQAIRVPLRCVHACYHQLTYAACWQPREAAERGPMGSGLVVQLSCEADGPSGSDVHQGMYLTVFHASMCMSSDHL
jgi:hypothetical protein